ncbi:MAG: hypothetical protein E7676_01600 [Ruminococcaceae bacterium]|nr:hypothetical protein [Oscillospiraceae bacterium]
MSKNGFDKELLEFSSVMHSGYLLLLRGAGKIIALLTIIVTALVTFTDISFQSFTSEGFSSSLIVMLISSYIVYFSLEESGEALGNESDEYRDALSAYREARAKIGVDSVAALREFCSDYRREELLYRRKNFLMEKGLSGEEYEEYKRGGTVSKRAARAFRRADAMRAISLTPATLLSGERGGGGSELESPEKKKLLTSLRILIPSTACMIFTISVILTAKGDMTASVIIDGILKLSALPIIGLRAYSAGYSYAKEEKSLWLEARARLLSSFANQKNNA